MSHVNPTCSTLRQHLALYAGRDLEAPLCSQVEQHLAGCGACRDELQRTLAARERIAAFGAHNARGLEQVDLWPAVREACARERTALETEVAALDLSRRRSALRRWLPLSLAAAAALVIAWQWGGGGEEAPDSDVVHTPPPVITPNVAQNSGPTVPVEPVSSGSLRRAAPGDERLRDLAAPLAWPPRSRLPRTGADSTNSLAGDDGLR